MPLPRSARRPRPLRAALTAGAVPAVLLAAVPAQAEAAATTHTVRAGETPYGIARQHGVALADLLALNGLDMDSVIHVGDVLDLGEAPATTSPAAPGTTTVQAGEGWWQVARRVGVSMTSLLQLNDATVATVLHPGMVLVTSATAEAPSGVGATTYTVQPGDGWWGIARRTGVAATTLQRLNDMTASTVLHPGMVLRTSGQAASPAPLDAEEAAPTLDDEETAGVLDVEETSTTTAEPAPTERPALTEQPPAPTAGAVVRHVVDTGDSLWSLSQRYDVSIPRLRELNGLTYLSVLHDGDVLVIKDGTEPPTPDVSDLPVGTTFLYRSYPTHVTVAANENLRLLQARDLPSQAEMKEIVRATAVRMGVDPRLALAHAYTESTFRMGLVSPANAIGCMQVIPITGEFSSQLVGRELDLLDPYDNATAGVAYIKWVQENAPTRDLGIGAYYQGLNGVVNEGPWPDTYTYIAKVKAAMAMF